MLGIKIHQNLNEISLNQQHFTESLLKLYGMAQCESVATPLLPHEHLLLSSDKEREDFKKLKINYRSAMGSINYLSVATRPDISFAVSALSQYLDKPGINHWNAFLHVLRYLRGSQELGVIYKTNCKTVIEAYSNADWGNCRATRRSVTGYLISFHNCALICKARKQSTVSIPTAEAEYKALCDLMSELLWLKQLCEEAKITKISQPIVIWEDNQSCIKIANDDCNFNNKRMKHVDIQLHFIKEVIKAKIINLQYKPTNEMLANFLTNSVSR
ncbi:hypothetical protein O181_001306 [Austropuccinia psidii MF-1]|uniref:Reverse transcriptase Ty1/copia-type domain-containing protein n=1 Tax=Austropuccinia psidii MF-1 TaxID=1389203 RepID=A0A9Q3GCA2_9BASI|nr:hypothetical protein [Austropuccinia psidii MF-1]